ncbi:MAG: GNAT family N-acetyltransferase [Erysipelotrichaceae bacterium]|nr:GNAT family N-acetyltransferase [Erysipelotrichaceae bacterium]
MLNFEPFSLSALKKVLPYIKESPLLCSDLSAGYLYMWHEDTDVHFCVWKDTFTVMQKIGEQPAFTYPIGPCCREMIDEIALYARENGLPLRFYAIDDEVLEKLLNDDGLKEPMYAYDRKWSDYIYNFEEAMTFKGKKYSGQRNHVNRFRKLYGEPDIRFLNEGDVPAVEEMLKEYELEHPDGDALEKMELEQTKKLFSVSRELSLHVAGMFVNDRLIAFSIGETVNRTLIIHVEKALTCYKGVYPTMYSGFVRLISENTDRQLYYVNREDDSGDPGLRTSKLQYQPICIAHKYLLHLGSPAYRMEKEYTVKGKDAVLTEFRETDKHAYLELNTDIENNRYWGYDYREDLYLDDPEDENTFYDSAVYDMKCGDSINFAVRLSKDGDMIGETILWNFSSDGQAELGCRILKGYQERGLGKDAFIATAEYARNVLGLELTVRCYRENRASYGMISSTGLFTLSREDEGFYYFEEKKKEV